MAVDPPLAATKRAAAQLLRGGIAADAAWQNQFLALEMSLAINPTPVFGQIAMDDISRRCTH
jgi:hypothetical protein